MVSWEELIIEDSHHRHTSPLNEDGLWCGCLRFIPLAPQSLSFHLVYHVFIHVRLFETCQAPLSMEFPRQEYWSGLPFPTPGDLPNPGTEPGSPALQVDSLLSEPPGKPTQQYNYCTIFTFHCLSQFVLKMKCFLYI